MKVATRIIAKLDIKGPNLIKGFQLDGFRVLGPVESFAESYYHQGADELFYQDAVASVYQRNSLLEIVARTAKRSFLPLTVAGGIRSVSDITALLRAGADKVAINTAAVSNPRLIQEAVKALGSQCIVGSMEIFRQDNGAAEVWVDYGRERTHLDALQWARTLVDLGVGELMITSIRRDGTGTGFDVELIKRITEMVPVPVIASGGAGNVDHVVDVVEQTGASAVALGSMFHYYYAAMPQQHDKSLRMGKSVDTGSMDFLCDGYGGFRKVPVTPISIPHLRQSMREKGITVREFECAP